MRKLGLLLSGYACRSWIWEEAKKELDTLCELEVIDWPRKRTSDFNSIQDFALWVRENKMNLDKTYDFIIGHSLGGLVGLEIAKMENSQIKKVILIESFITSPNCFFQNLMMENVSPELKEKVNIMLDQEQQYYSEHLKYQLRELDMTKLVINLTCEVVALYGDRGCMSFNHLQKNLQWSEVLRSKVSLDVICQSCHFPMLENPKKVVDILKNKI